MVSVEEVQKHNMKFQSDKLEKKNYWQVVAE